MSRFNMLQAAMRFCRQQHPQLRASQVELLLAAAARPGSAQSELAAECDITLSAVSRAVDVMGGSGRKDLKSGVKMRWLETKRNPDDERIVQVFVTPKGRQFLETLEAILYGSQV